MKAEEFLLEKWRIASELHRHMDDIAWRTFSYFVAANGVFLSATVGIVTTSNKADALLPPKAVKPLAVAMPVLGFLLSVAWCFIQGRQRSYHGYRADQAKQIEAALEADGEQTVHLYAERLDEQKLFKVDWSGKLQAHLTMVRVAVGFAVVWLLLFVFLLIAV